MQYTVSYTVHSLLLTWWGEQGHRLQGFFSKNFQSPLVSYICRMPLGGGFRKKISQKQNDPQDKNWKCLVFARMKWSFLAQFLQLNVIRIDVQCSLPPQIWSWGGGSNSHPKKKGRGCSHGSHVCYFENPIHKETLYCGGLEGGKPNLINPNSILTLIITLTLTLNPNPKFTDHPKF